MINVQKFLKTLNIKGDIYAFVTYKEIKKEATYFAKHFYKDEPWFLESPCELYKYGDEYEIENFQYSPYLPEEVEEIEIISEKDCLDHLLNLNKLNS